MKDAKIFFYISNLAKGGAERVCINLAEYFYSLGYDVGIVTSYKSENEYYLNPEINRILLNDTYYSGNVIYRNTVLIKRLRNIIKSEKPDVLISFMAESNLRSLVSTIGIDLVRIVSVRNDPNREYSGILGKITGKLIMPFAEGAVFQTKDAMNWFPNRLKKKSKVILNPVREEVFDIHRSTESGRIISIGRLDEQKNQILLIDSFKEVLKTNNNAKLYIYGEGKLRNTLINKIDSEGLQDSVFLCGYFNDVVEVLSKAELFVLSSNFEGLPNALMEALAAGVPCISTNCPSGGPKALIKNGVNGILTPVNDNNALTSAMTRLLDDESFRDYISNNAKKISKEFKTNKINRQWKDYISKLYYLNYK